jgi:hypothetical protein
MSAAAAGAVPESHLVLKYNAVVGRDPFPPIAELARQLGLRVEAGDDESTGSGKHLRVVHVRGPAKAVAELERSLLRFPAVTSKVLLG